MPLSPLYKGTIVSAPSPLLVRALRVTCLRVVLGRYQRRSLTLFAFVQAYVAEVIRYIRTSFLLFASDQVRSPANFHSILGGIVHYSPSVIHHISAPEKQSRTAALVKDPKTRQLPSVIRTLL